MPIAAREGDGWHGNGGEMGLESTKQKKLGIAEKTSCWAGYDAETSGHSLGLSAPTLTIFPRSTWAGANEPKSGHADHPTWDTSTTLRRPASRGWM
ncbi:hypothetical protein CORC01_09056 [Colletotrichum orchidophilum]|uniref:Uncharacterized protein n=1 Tax=Colletotrichum orchidophilum TaxID=1209926 RepID=A0A1G4B2K8_9PEZI|nr:uncharacterized protein CORC01_09056 [Colletotrichum orchidophilum]OHE95624.1 hypothetical protein CORC01_09056 [Colletotrichum orchidophilum]